MKLRGGAKSHWHHTRRVFTPLSRNLSSQRRRSAPLRLKVGL